MSILSIQSHVAYGCAGNRAAVFPLQRLGFDVWPVNTVQFSNHMGYGGWEGDVFPADHVARVFRGIHERGVLPECSAVLSGFLGDPEIGGVILEAARSVKDANPKALYCCDPVMGDYDRGATVHPGIPDFLRTRAVQTADIITPNQFEAELLSGLTIRNARDARRAADVLHRQGPRLVLITSFKPETAEDGSISLFLSEPERAWMLTTPELPLHPPLVGAGDLTAALFLGHYLKSGDPRTALELMADTVFTVLERTVQDGFRELRLVQCQDRIAQPGRRFSAVPV
ncbi:MAG: pyridoxal kinase PdxY [Treponema sp.]|nr:pyridoxal kinase PdxY [Treponema sp.]